MRADKELATHKVHLAARRKPYHASTASATSEQQLIYFE